MSFFCRMARGVDPQDMSPGGLAPGSVFLGRYEIVGCIRSGGMGAVYECIHLKTRKRRALKVMLPQVIAYAGMRERFELEARVTADIESDHLVETFDAGVDEVSGTPFLVMELLRGEDLDSHVRARGPLTAEETVMFLGQTALALDKTHAAGIVHRDLKPQNLFLTTRDDGTPRVKVLDFGIAKVVAESERATQRTATLGTPVYMSPEQIEGQGIGPRADLYALAHVAYALLVGQAYWEEENQASHSHWGTWKVIMAGVREPASLRARRYGVTLPVTFDAWFVRATALAAADRYDSAAALVTSLAHALGVAAPRTSHADAAPRTSKLPREASSSLARESTLVLPDARERTPAGATRPSVPDAPSSLRASRAARDTPPRSATTSPVSDDVPVELPVKSRGQLMAAAVVGLAAVAGAGVLAFRQPPSPVASVSVAVAPVAPPELAVAPPPAVTAEPTRSSAVASLPATPSATPAVAPRAGAPRVAKPAPPVAPATAARPAVNCNPPFTVDAAGDKHAKPECL